jgi:hypothetical protein
MSYTTPSPTPRSEYTSKTDPALNAITADDIDTYLGVVITLTGAGNNQTLPSPSGSITPPSFTVINDDASTNSIDIIGSSTVTLAAGEAATFVWDGSVWASSDNINLWLDDGTDLTAVNSVLTLVETTTPGAVASSGKVYTKSDNKFYFQDGAGAEHEVTGNVVGPASVVDEKIAVFDSTTGKLIKSTIPEIDTSGNIQLISGNIFLDDGSRTISWTSTGRTGGALRSSLSTNSGGTLTVTASIFSITAGQTWNRTASAGDYNPSALTDDYLIAITDTSSARTVTISNEDIAKGTPTLPRAFIIKDESGAAATNNITVQGESGNIDGGRVKTMALWLFMRMGLICLQKAKIPWLAGRCTLTIMLSRK